MQTNYLNEEKYQNTKRKISMVSIIILAIGLTIGISLIVLGISNKNKLDSKYSEESKKEQVENEMELNFESEEIGNARLKVVNNVKFDDSIEIEEFNENNNLVINGLTQEQINNLFTNLGKIISEKIEDETTYVYVALGIPFAVLEGTILEQEIVSGMMGIGVTTFVGINKNLYDKAETTLQQTNEMMIYEATSLARAEILSRYYQNEITLDEITEELIKEEIETYLDETYNVEVIKKEEKLEFTILADGIELDEERSKLDLTGLR